MASGWLQHAAVLLKLIQMERVVLLISRRLSHRSKLLQVREIKRLMDIIQAIH